ncbi:hypothetical protein RRF57_005499 [Xylaria bambusicola]|uniref:Uncharacterized protein n=1 Tax=Xylaria bambusicola TaxID=326684 RepID=A0AAN7UMC8_9PEZI
MTITGEGHSNDNNGQQENEVIILGSWSVAGYLVICRECKALCKAMAKARQAPAQRQQASRFNGSLTEPRCKLNGFHQCLCSSDTFSAYGHVAWALCSPCLKYPSYGTSIIAHALDPLSIS